MKITSIEALKQLTASGNLFQEVFQHGTLSVEVYRPIEIDHQQPHERDEVYIIITGQGTFLKGAEKYHVQTGDFLFVPAGVIHRF
jgi:mannose-6-phosphate isomerase-like protein (cupin superfamily)